MNGALLIVSSTMLFIRRYWDYAFYGFCGFLITSSGYLLRDTILRRAFAQVLAKDFNLSFLLHQGRAMVSILASLPVFGH
jgi:hypothetical protein